MPYGVSSIFRIQFQMDYVHSFPAISQADATKLILGSMPGRISLTANQYYAHPRNHFWSFIESILGIEQSLPYEKRCAQLTECGVAVWDVLKVCSRTGSLDSDIIESSIVPNDFDAFLATHSRITNIYFNGAKAEKIYAKYVLPLLRPEASEIQTTKLPSTSPANASMPLNYKIDQWSTISR